MATSGAAADSGEATPRLTSVIKDMKEGKNGLEAGRGASRSSTPRGRVADERGTTDTPLSSKSWGDIDGLDDLSDDDDVADEPVKDEPAEDGGRLVVALPRVARLVHELPG